MIDFDWGINQIFKKFCTKQVLAVLILLIVDNVYASDNLRTQNVDETFGFYFKFEITNRSELEQLTRMISVDNVKGNTVYAFATPDQLVELKRFGYEVEFLPISGSAKELTMATTIAEMANWDRYPTYDVYLAMMYQFVSNYPNICRLENLGYSVDNREILAIKISDNPDLEEDEPEFFYTAQMHGNEIVTYIMMLRLIDYLLSGYGLDPEVTKMVDEIEIWINPLANPDGTYHGSNNDVSSSQRYNANYVDLNRNFPDPQDGPHPDGNAWQPETIVMMNFAETHSIIHSANFHSGAEVVNYPWDTWNILHADNDWYIDISKAYADTVFANAPAGYFQSVSPTGYIRGYAWYTTNGNRQDYMNWFHACRETTIELSNSKLLSSSLLPAYWNYNKRSLINYIENVLYGIRGIVTDSLGDPLEAMITVVDHDFDHSEVYTDPDVGDYHRMISPGTYDITISASDFAPQTITNITVSDTGAIRVDVVLQKSEIEINDSSRVKLYQNFPNPFHSTTTITFSLPKHLSNPILKIYDLKGRLVSETMLNELTSYTWNGRDMKQKPVSSGIYLYQILSDGYTSKIKKMILLNSE